MRLSHRQGALQIAFEQLKAKLAEVYLRQMKRRSAFSTKDCDRHFANRRRDLHDSSLAPRPQIPVLSCRH